MLMINLQKTEEPNMNNKQQQVETETEENAGQSNHSQTINGLEVIEEEETDRTLLDSVHSINEEAKFTHSSESFIKI